MRLTSPPVLLVALSATTRAFQPSFHRASFVKTASPRLSASVTSETVFDTDGITARIAEASKGESSEWASRYGQGESESSFHALFTSVRTNASPGIDGAPFHLKDAGISEALGGSRSFSGFFTFDDLASAVRDDFLDANRGSTDNRKGWKVSAVSDPRGTSFEEARMSLEDVETALDKGTVIFNTVGSHVPKLAGATLACTDAAVLPCASNMYVTLAGKRTSAPPHTDKQDVVVVQTQGKKHWRVYSPPNPALNPSADMYARGKGDDNLSLYSLEKKFECEKLLDVVLEEGDVLFVPAGFPHTTDTVDHSDQAKTSIHLTFNFDNHVWDLNYLNLRRLALMRAGIKDMALGEEDNPYTGKVNLLPSEVRTRLLEAVPLGSSLELLDDEDSNSNLKEDIASQLSEICHAVDPETASAAENALPTVWKETVDRVHLQGIELFDIHREMYLAAIDEGATRDMEAQDAGDRTSTGMTAERMQRLSLFRVQKFYERIDVSKQTLADWSREGEPQSGPLLPADWEFTFKVKVGDQVEADIGGAFFPATVTTVSGNKYGVRFFDGDSDSGLERSMIKLINPPS